MTTLVLMMLTGIVIGAVAGVVPMYVIARMRSKSARDNAIASVSADMRCLEERAKASQNELARLRDEKDVLQARHSEAVQKAAGFESRAQSLDRQVIDLKADIGARDRKIDELNNVVKQDRGELSQLETRLAGERKQAEEKLELLVEARDRLKSEFQNLANSIFDEKTKSFSEQSKAHLDLVLNPLRDQLGDFRKRVDAVYASESKDRQTLADKILELTNLNQQVSKNADNLTKALQGGGSGSKTQGNWGEMILARALELSGLKEGAEYQSQVSGESAEGDSLILDVVVHLPEGRDVVVDSKVTLDAYRKFVSAETDGERENALCENDAAVKKHIDGLSAKSYETHSKIRSLDFVLMFMPIEAAFVEAIKRDPGLFEYAFNRHIILVCPSTLLVTLRTIQNMWQSEKQNRNALDIADRAGALYDKFAGFVETLTAVKNSIAAANEKCDQAFSQLKSGRGSIISRVEYFRGIVKTKKNLPSSLLDAAGDDDGLPEIDNKADSQC